MEIINKNPLTEKQIKLLMKLEKLEKELMQ